MHLAQKSAWKAAAAADAALDLFRPLGELERAAAATQVLVRSLLAEEDPQNRVAGLLADMRTRCQEAGETQAEAVVTLTRAEVHAALGERVASLTVAKEAQLLFNQAGDVAGEADALRQMAELQTVLEKHKAAAVVAKKGRKLYRRLGLREHELRLALIAVQASYKVLLASPLTGSVVYRTSDESAKRAWADLLKEAEELAALAVSAGDRRAEGLAHVLTSHVHSAQLRPMEAALSADEAAMAYFDTGELEAEAGARVLKAKTLVEARALMDGREAATAALSLAREAAHDGHAATAREVLQEADRLLGVGAQ